MRFPAANDLVGIYEDVGIGLNGPQSSTRFNDPTSESRGPAIGAIRTSSERYQFELKIFPSNSNPLGEQRKPCQGLRKVSTTTNATHTGQYENLLRPRGVVRTTSFQFESSMGGQALWGQKMNK